MKNISIEYAHIYTNNKISEEHSLSLTILRKVQKKLGNNNSLSLVVLVDDYSFPDPTFDYGSFSSFLETNGFKPDCIFRESQLIPLCDETLRLMADSALKESIIDYVRARKYPCSLFIASWYLLRLGFFTHVGFNKTLCAERLINILPESFKPFEDKALEIIASTSYSECVNKIEYEYIKGRLLA